MKTLEGFRVETTQICLENEDMGGGGEGGGNCESHQKLLRGDHFSEVTFKRGSAKFHLV